MKPIAAVLPILVLALPAMAADPQPGLWEVMVKSSGPGRPP